MAPPPPAVRDSTPRPIIPWPSSFRCFCAMHWFLKRQGDDIGGCDWKRNDQNLRGGLQSHVRYVYRNASQSESRSTLGLGGTINDGGRDLALFGITGHLLPSSAISANFVCFYENFIRRRKVHSSSTRLSCQTIQMLGFGRETGFLVSWDTGPSDTMVTSSDIYLHNNLRIPVQSRAGT